MEIAIEWLVGLLSAAFFSFLGLFGWSHKALNAKIDHLDDVTMKKQDIKTLIELELRPLEIEYKVLEKKTDLIAEAQKLFNGKLDQISDKLTDLTVLTNKKG